MKKYDIGAETAAALYEKITSAAETYKVANGNEYIQLFQELKLQAMVKWSEWKAKFVPAKEEPEEQTQYYEDGEEIVSVEDATVFVPRVTPEMEEEYRKKNKKE